MPRCTLIMGSKKATHLKMAGNECWSQVHILHLIAPLISTPTNLYSLGCLDSERRALLNFKAAENPNSNALVTWVSDRGSNCCAWQQVKCNPTTGRVVQLSLSGTIRRRLFNASMFLAFKELQHLDVSDARLVGWYLNQGFERLSELKNLEVLILHSNDFNSSVVSSLGALKSLKTLDLHSNQLGHQSEESPQGFAMYERWSRLKKLEVLILNTNFGLINELIPYLSALTSIKTLDLSSTGLGPLSEISRGLVNMSKLEALSLDRIITNGTIPPSLLSLKSLKSLTLASNNLKDSISGFCELKNLQYLDLNTNRFEGILPPCLSNLTSLRMLDFSNNQLSGTIPPFLLSNLKSLEFISLSQNKFQGPFSSTSPVAHRFQLRHLALSDCNLNTSTTDLLNFLHNQYDLRHLDISHNNVHGQVPSWLVKNNTRLQNLLLRNNSLNGPILFPFNRNLLSVDLSDNRIQAPIQTDIGVILPNLRYLNFSTNSLQGILPSSLGKLTSLNVLDVSSNNFSGRLPESLGLGCRLLETLALSNNKLQGPIPPPFFNLTVVRSLLLANNRFTGSIPSDVGFTGLYTLDVSNNLMSGGIPTWMGDLDSLWTIVLRRNSFDGPIPRALCRNIYIQYIDLSHNRISGSVPSCLLTMQGLYFLHLQGNKLTGLPNALSGFPGMITINLNDNNFSGAIPSWFGSFTFQRELTALLLKGNRFSGPVPQELCQLAEMRILDLSENLLSGSIPSCFSTLNFGRTRGYYLRFDNSFGYAIPTYGYTDLMGDIVLIETNFPVVFTVPQEIEFRNETYKDDNLTAMSGIDISNNRFTGRIPPELGALSAIRALDFSHNQLTGPIPKALSNMTRLETMDLSYNRLSGMIPAELTTIRHLSYFTVAYNNLSGRIPEGRFATFGEASYEGNPLLCGPVLRRKCNQ